ncbi:MAG: calcium/sodium antiporter [Planctomycetota bacterium]
MNIVWAIILLAGGLVMLWKSADLLVAGAVAMAQRLGVSPLIIGLTIVAMGTSAPEVAASIVAAVGDNGDAAIGNVFGSNIANLALVGGLVALIRPLRIQLRTLCREIPVMLLVALLLWPVLYDKSLLRLEGLVLLSVFAGLILLTVYAARKDTKRLATGNTEKELKPNSVKPPNSVAKENERNTQYAIRNTKKSVLFIVIGLVGLALGAEMAVKGAVFIGGRIGLSDAVIGLTIIAIGTSLPELATCLVAAVKGHHDISVGNLVGSNIFNTLLVTGTAGMVCPFTLAEAGLAGGAYYWIMIAVSAGFAFLAVIGRRVIGRAGGIILLCSYVGYMVYLFCL